MQFPVPEVLDLMYVGSIGMCSVSSEPEGKSALPWCEAECTPCVLLNVNALDSWRSQRTNRAARGELFPKESVLMSSNHVWGAFELRFAGAGGGSLWHGGALPCARGGCARWGAVPAEGLLLTQLLRAGMMPLIHYSMPVALLRFISQLEHGAL